MISKSTITIFVLVFAILGFLLGYAGSTSDGHTNQGDAPGGTVLEMDEGSSITSVFEFEFGHEVH